MPEPTEVESVPADVAASLAARAALREVRVVLVDTALTRNIGAAARAMKTMGLSRLQLVRPQHAPDGESYKLASGAHDLLERAESFDDLSTALADCALVFGVSARRRRIAMPLESPESAALACLAMAADQPVALVFGGEEAGLSNADLLRCHRLLQIPSDHGFASLNLAAAVQVISYELRKAALQGRFAAPVRQSAPHAEFEQFLGYLHNLLPHKGGSLLQQRLRRLIQRAAPSRAELRMLRGLIASLRPRS